MLTRLIVSITFGLIHRQMCRLNRQYFFEGFHLGADQSVAVSVNEQNESSQSARVGEDSIEKHTRLYGAIYAFRDIEHTQRTFDPLNDKVKNQDSLERLGLERSDLNEIHFWQLSWGS